MLDTLWGNYTPSQAIGDKQTQLLPAKPPQLTQVEGKELGKVNFL